MTGAACIGAPAGDLSSIGEDRQVTMTTQPPINTTQLRLSRTPMDMTKAVLVLLVPVAVLVAIYVFFFGGSNPIVIDPSQTFSTARSSANFTVVQPAGLSDKWKPISAAYAGDLLRVGYIAPSGDGVQLVESSQPANKVLGAELGNTDSVATAVTLGDTSWGQLTVHGQPTKALVSTVGNRTVIIKGPTDFSTLQALAAALT